MIQKDNFHALLLNLGFSEHKNTFTKHFAHADCELKVDFGQEKLIYPEDKGLKINERQTCNFASSENAVVFECVYRLLDKGYKPEHIELEPKWKLGHGASGGRADILVRDQQATPLLIIECKTFGKEFDKAWKNTLDDGAQLFSYIEQEKATQFVCLYASEWDDKTSQLNTQQKIISVKDNDKILEESPKLASFAKADNSKQRFKVWKDTYQQEATETGVFEDNIHAYHIGKDKYTLLQDTKIIDAKDIKGMYHKFRTILRKHNVSRRENAFEVLVNLFLCKIVDELENPNDLKFYWKGIAYDNYFDLVDRLQSLYKTGMEQFLNQDIVYISNDEIDSAFWAVKQKRNATKLRIKEIFRELKFYKGLDFEFIKVFNKAYFDKNAKILLEIIQMWQGLRLTSSGQNQFLGDMFEYFLDNGIKQSEGQFFTPVPICKFIVSALPLEHLIATHSEPIKAIDYACGSGHFLTEYAVQIPSLLQSIKHLNDPTAYYKAIYGIEKEDRLAKVAKVSAFMYGRKEIQIIDADALVPHADIKEAGFNVLIANPPFAVEDFLLTIDDEHRDKYTLINTANDMSNKNIQCFFLERAQQLLAGDGVMGVIVPSSVLSNSDQMHVATREILLKYFDFVSITELGNNTFGKTGTNTVILFLRRKAQRPEPSEHYWNRTLDFFDNWLEESAGSVYGDTDVVRHYCTHIEIDYAHYQTLLTGKPCDELLATEMFKDYRNDFDGLTEIKKLKAHSTFNKKTKAAQTAELQQRFDQYLTAIEQNKLYYFMLAHSNPCPVVLVKSPADNKEQKKFLGYEWSGAKGSEGVIYNGGETVNDINTPMFDPKDRNNTSKISHIVRQNFLGQTVQISADLQPHVTQAQLTDLLDFGRKDFNKAFSLTVKKQNAVASKWDLVSLDSILLDKNQTFNKIPKNEIKEAGKYPVVTQERNEIISGYTDIVEPITALPLIVFGDHSCTFKYIDFPFVRGADGTQILLPNKSKVAAKYLFNFLLFVDIEHSERYERHYKYLKNIKIPLPPLNIQQEIVAACEVVDEAVRAAQVELERSAEAINVLLENISAPLKKLSEVVKINPSRTEIKHIDEMTLVSFVEMASVSEKGFITNKTDKLLKDLKKGSYTYFAENDVIVAKITPCMENGKCAVATGLTNGLAMGSTEFHVFRASEGINGRFLFALLNREGVRKEAENNFTGSSGHRRVPAAFYENYKIPVPPLTEQTALVAQIEAIELKMVEAQRIINDAPAQKQAVLQYFL